MEILKRFCRKEEERVVRLSEPFSQGEHTYATNGWVAVRVPRIADVPEQEKAPVMAGLPWDHADLEDWDTLPEFDTAGARECRHCKGVGKQQVCYECDGDGGVGP